MLTKVIVFRLKQIMDKIINPLQASFVPGRQAADNILITQEFIHSFKKFKANTGGIMVKIDLENAYDKVDWGFLIQILTLFNFP